MDKELIEDKLYQIIDQFNERKSTFTKFYSILLNKIHPFYDRNGRTCKLLKCRKNTESKNPKAARINNGRIMLLSKYGVYNSKKSKLIKQQEASGLSNSLGIKTPFFVLEVLTSQSKI